MTQIYVFLSHILFCNFLIATSVSLSNPALPKPSTVAVLPANIYSFNERAGILLFINSHTNKANILSLPSRTILAQDLWPQEELSFLSFSDDGEKILRINTGGVLTVAAVSKIDSNYGMHINDIFSTPSYGDDMFTCALFSSNGSKIFTLSPSSLKTFDINLGEEIPNPPHLAEDFDVGVLRNNYDDDVSAEQNQRIARFAQILAQSGDLYNFSYPNFVIRTVDSLTWINRFFEARNFKSHPSASRPMSRYSITWSNNERRDFSFSVQGTQGKFAVSPMGKYILCFSGGELRIWSVSSDETAAMAVPPQRERYLGDDYDAWTNFYSAHAPLTLNFQKISFVDNLQHIALSQSYASHLEQTSFPETPAGLDKFLDLGIMFTQLFPLLIENLIGVDEKFLSTACGTNFNFYMKENNDRLLERFYQIKYLPVKTQRITRFEQILALPSEQRRRTVGLMNPNGPEYAVARAFLEEQDEEKKRLLYLTLPDLAVFTDLMKQEDSDLNEIIAFQRLFTRWALMRYLDENDPTGTVLFHVAASMSLADLVRNFFPNTPFDVDFLNTLNNYSLGTMLKQIYLGGKIPKFLALKKQIKDGSAFNRAFGEVFVKYQSQKAANNWNMYKCLPPQQRLFLDGVWESMALEQYFEIGLQAVKPEVRPSDCRLL